jgi:DNA-directed RNA polymerase beta' subunit
MTKKISLRDDQRVARWSERTALRPAHVHGLPIRHAFGVAAGRNSTIVIPEQKTKIVAAADKDVKEIQDQYVRSRHQRRAYNKVVDIWSRANDQVAGPDGEARRRRRD